MLQIVAKGGLNGKQACSTLLPLASPWVCIDFAGVPVDTSRFYVRAYGPLPGDAARVD